jgi:hypothetical protein
MVLCQVGKGDRGDVTILPTIVINQRQYRGKLDKAAVTKAICSGFKETTDPPVCLSESNSNFPLRSYLPCKALIYMNLMMSSTQLVLDLHCYV